MGLSVSRLLPVLLLMVASCSTQVFDTPIDGSCSTSSECAENLVCPTTTSTCAAAYGRFYTMDIAGVSVPAKGPDGEAWDPFGGAPDLFIVVYVDGELVFKSDEVSDDFSAAWSSEYAQFELFEDSQVLIEAYDSDADANDLVDTLEFSGSALVANVVKSDSDMTTMYEGSYLYWRVTAY